MCAKESGADVTALLRAWRNEGSSEALLEAVYDSLRRIAASQLQRERSDHTLQPTALVNEAWLKLVGERADFQDRAHFFAIAAQAMRRILVDHARRKRAVKRAAPEPTTEPVLEGFDVDVLAVDAALTKLAALDERQARVVELKYFGGLTNEEAALVMGVSLATLKRAWQTARAFLFRELAAT